MRINQEIKEILNVWRPELGNSKDIAIWKMINSPIGKFRILDKEQKELIRLLKERLKEGAIKPSVKKQII
jgi:hypothetical protein